MRLQWYHLHKEVAWCSWQCKLEDISLYCFDENLTEEA